MDPGEPLEPLEPKDSLDTLDSEGAAPEETVEGASALTPGQESVDTLEKGALSPLTGSYLLIVLAEPHSEEDREIIIKRLTKGLRSWDLDSTHVDLSCELLNLANAAPESDEARNGEKLVQWASENLVVEVLIHCQVNTLLQCMKNLLSSFTKHRHIIHAGYTFQGSGSWILQDGTFSITDFVELWEEPEVHRILGAYKGDISVSLHCAEENGWVDERLRRESFTKLCQVSMNPEERLVGHSSGIISFIEYISKLMQPASLKEILEPSEIVGNIRFSHPTLYVFPGGQGDAALFGVNGFNMLIDGGFSRRSCFWDFTRHLDRLDAVLLTRVNNNAVGGLDSVLDRKRLNQVYPQIGHFFGNVMERKHPEMEKESGELLVSLTETGQRMLDNLKNINLRPQHCFREHSIEPINLYHKVGHGKLDMYVLNPAKDSREVREFLSKWNTDCKSFVQARMSVKVEGKEMNYPVLNLVSICALLVWQPDNPRDPITRILFPGSTPQQKIFEALGKLKHLEFLKYPICSAKTIAASHKSRVKSERLVSEAKSQLSSGIRGSDSTAEVKVSRAPSESRVTSRYSSNYGNVRSKVSSSQRSDSSSTIQTGESLEKEKSERKGRERSREKKRATSAAAPIKSVDRDTKEKDNKIIEQEVKKSSSRRVDSGLSKTSSSAKVERSGSTKPGSNVSSRIDTGKKSSVTSPPTGVKSDKVDNGNGPSGTSTPTTKKTTSSSKYGIGVTRTVVSKASASAPGSAGSPPPTPPKSAKDASNRKVIEHKAGSTRKSLIDSAKSKESKSAKPPPAPVKSSATKTSRPQTAAATRKSGSEPSAVKRPGSKVSAAAVGAAAATVAGAIGVGAALAMEAEHNASPGDESKPVEEQAPTETEAVNEESIEKDSIEDEVVHQNGVGLSAPVTESSSELSSLEHVDVEDQIEIERNGHSGTEASEDVETAITAKEYSAEEAQSETHTITEPCAEGYDEEDEYLIVEKDESTGAEEIQDSNIISDEHLKAENENDEQLSQTEKGVEEEKEVVEEENENEETPHRQELTKSSEEIMDEEEIPEPEKSRKSQDIGDSVTDQKLSDIETSHGSDGEEKVAERPSSEALETSDREHDRDSLSPQPEELPAKSPTMVDSLEAQDILREKGSPGGISKSPAAEAAEDDSHTEAVDKVEHENEPTPEIANDEAGEGQVSPPPSPIDDKEIPPPEEQECLEEAVSKIAEDTEDKEAEIEQEHEEELDEPKETNVIDSNATTDEKIESEDGPQTEKNNEEQGANENDEQAAQNDPFIRAEDEKQFDMDAEALVDDTLPEPEADSHDELKEDVLESESEKPASVSPVPSQDMKVESEEIAAKSPEVEVDEDKKSVRSVSPAGSVEDVVESKMVTDVSKTPEPMQDKLSVGSASPARSPEPDDKKSTGKSPEPEEDKPEAVSVSPVPSTEDKLSKSPEPTTEEAGTTDRKLSSSIVPDETQSEHEEKRSIPSSPKETGEYISADEDNHVQPLTPEFAQDETDSSSVPREALIPDASLSETREDLGSKMTEGKSPLSPVSELKTESVVSPTDITKSGTSSPNLESRSRRSSALDDKQTDSAEPDVGDETHEVIKPESPISKDKLKLEEADEPSNESPDEKPKSRKSSDVHHKDIDDLVVPTEIKEIDETSKPSHESEEASADVHEEPEGDNDNDNVEEEVKVESTTNKLQHQGPQAESQTPTPEPEVNVVNLISSEKESPGKLTPTADAAEVCAVSEIQTKPDIDPGTETIVSDESKQDQTESEIKPPTPTDTEIKTETPDLDIEPVQVSDLNVSNAQLPETESRIRDLDREGGTEETENEVPEESEIEKDISSPQPLEVKGQQGMDICSKNEQELQSSSAQFGETSISLSQKSEVDDSMKDVFSPGDSIRTDELDLALEEHRRRLSAANMSGTSDINLLEDKVDIETSRESQFGSINEDTEDDQLHFKTGEIGDEEEAQTPIQVPTNLNLDGNNQKSGAPSTFQVPGLDYTEGHCKDHKSKSPEQTGTGGIAKEKEIEIKTGGKGRESGQVEQTAVKAPSKDEVTATGSAASRPIPSAIPSKFPRESREVIRTPDEVADLPVHEEVEPGTYETDEFVSGKQGQDEDVEHPEEGEKEESGFPTNVPSPGREKPQEDLTTTTAGAPTTTTTSQLNSSVTHTTKDEESPAPDVELESQLDEKFTATDESAKEPEQQETGSQQMPPSPGLAASELPAAIVEKIDAAVSPVLESLLSKSVEKSFGKVESGTGQLESTEDVNKDEDQLGEVPIASPTTTNTPAISQEPDEVESDKYSTIQTDEEQTETRVGESDEIGIEVGESGLGSKSSPTNTEKPGPDSEENAPESSPQKEMDGDQDVTMEKAMDLEQPISFAHRPGGAITSVVITPSTPPVVQSDNANEDKLTHFPLPPSPQEVEAEKAGENETADSNEVEETKEMSSSALTQSETNGTKSPKDEDDHDSAQILTKDFPDSMRHETVSKLVFPGVSAVAEEKSDESSSSSALTAIVVKGESPKDIIPPAKLGGGVGAESTSASDEKREKLFYLPDEDDEEEESGTKATQDTSSDNGLLGAVEAGLLTAANTLSAPVVHQSPESIATIPTSTPDRDLSPERDAKSLTRNSHSPTSQEVDKDTLVPEKWDDKTAILKPDEVDDHLQESESTPGETSPNSGVVAPSQESQESHEAPESHEDEAKSPCESEPKVDSVLADCDTLPMSSTINQIISQDSDEPISETLIETAHSAVSSACDTAAETLDAAHSTVDEVERHAGNLLQGAQSEQIEEENVKEIEDIPKSLKKDSETTPKEKSPVLEVEDKICDSMKRICHDGNCHEEDEEGPEVVEEPCVKSIAPKPVIPDEFYDGDNKVEKIKSTTANVDSSIPASENEQNVEESGETSTGDVFADLEDQMITKEELDADKVKDSTDSQVPPRFRHSQESSVKSPEDHIKSPVMDQDEPIPADSKSQEGDVVQMIEEEKQATKKKRKQLTDYIGTIREAKAVFDTLLKIAKSGAALSSAVDECKTNAQEAIRRHLEAAEEYSYRPARHDPEPDVPDSPEPEQGITVYESLEQMARAGAELFTGLVEKVENEIVEQEKREADPDPQPETEDEAGRRYSAEIAVNAALQHLHETFKAMQTLGGSPKRSSSAAARRMQEHHHHHHHQHDPEEEVSAASSSAVFSTPTSMHLSTSGSASMIESTLKSPDDETERSEGETMRESMASFTSGVVSEGDDILSNDKGKSTSQQQIHSPGGTEIEAEGQNDSEIDNDKKSEEQRRGSETIKSESGTKTEDKKEEESFTKSEEELRQASSLESHEFSSLSSEQSSHSSTEFISSVRKISSSSTESQSIKSGATILEHCVSEEKLTKKSAESYAALQNSESRLITAAERYEESVKSTESLEQHHQQEESRQRMYYSEEEKVGDDSGTGTSPSVINTKDPLTITRRSSSGSGADVSPSQSNKLFRRASEVQSSAQTGDDFESTSSNNQGEGQSTAVKGDNEKDKESSGEFENNQRPSSDFGYQTKESGDEESHSGNYPSIHGHSTMVIGDPKTISDKHTTGDMGSVGDSSVGKQAQSYPAFPQDIMEEEAYSSGDFTDSQPSSIPTQHAETDEEVQNFDQLGSTSVVTKGDVDNGNYSNSTRTNIIASTHQVPSETSTISSTSDNANNATRGEQSTTDPSTSTPDILKEWGKPLGLPVIYTEGADGSTGPDSGNFGGRATPKKTTSSTKGPSCTPGKSTSGSSKDKRSSSRKSRHTPIYVDLAYVPHHGNSHYCDSEFFRMIRGRYYVFSGLEPSREVFEGLLQGKKQWEDKNLETTIIPTYDTDTLGYWVVDSEKELAEAKIDLAPSASRCTINLQDHETSCAAYRLEF